MSTKQDIVWLTLPEAARRLGISYTRIRQLVDEGKIDTYREFPYPDSRVYVMMSDVDALR